MNKETKGRQRMRKAIRKVEKDQYLKRHPPYPTSAPPGNPVISISGPNSSGSLLPTPASGPYLPSKTISSPIFGIQLLRKKGRGNNEENTGKGSGKDQQINRKETQGTHILK